MADPVLIGRRQVEISRGTAKLKSPTLATALIQTPAKALDLLKKEVKAVRLSDISIDDSGRVVVADEAFARALSVRMKTDIKNFICGFKC